MSTPAYHSVVVGGTFTAGDINQFVGTHAATIINQGVSQVGNTAANVNSFPTYNAGSQWIAQPFTTAGGQTTITRIELALSGTGTSFDTTLEIRTNNAGKPSNTVLWSCTLPAEVFGASLVYISVPCYLTGLTAATVYHIVLDGTTSATNYDNWGATAIIGGNNSWKSPNGTGTWTTLGVTQQFNVFNGTNGVTRNIIEDSPAAGPPARWTSIDYTNAIMSAITGTYPPNAARDGNSVPTIVREFCGGVRSVRSLNYNSASQLTSVA